MKKVFFTLSILCLFAIVLPLRISAQTEKATPEVLSQKVALFGKSIPQEKVFLHIDNTCYFVGDTIRFKAYVTRSDRNTLTDLSKIVYVELFTPDGYLVERQQIELPDGTGHGAICLTDSLYSGYYELRAYTRWMLNWGQCQFPHSRWTEDLFYNRKMAQDFFRDYDKIYSRVFPVFDQPQAPGEYFKDMTLRPMRRYFKSPSGKPELDVRFYPEGGELVAGTTARIAFEANTDKGEHIDVELTIRDKEKKEITKAKVVNRGRGCFSLPNVSENGDYEATFQYKGYDYSFTLPQPVKEGCALSIRQNNETIIAKIQSYGLTDATPLGLQVMCGGISAGFYPISANNGVAQTIEIPINGLKTGVNQFTLFDAEGRIYADRLFFVNRHDYDTKRIDISSIKSQYEPFEPIELQLKLNNAEGIVPNMSVSVRDRSGDEPTYDNGNILTEMLLSSELKGFVENPMFFFEKDDSLRRQALDLLMMVQGWRRHSWREMAGIDKFTLQYLPEKSQTISGCVNRINDFRIVSGSHVTEDNWDPGSGTIIWKEDEIERNEEFENSITESDSESEAYGIENTSTSSAMSETYSNSQQFPFSSGYTISNLKEEVNVWPTFIQGEHTLELIQDTQNGTFYMQTPLLYEDYILFLMAADLDKDKDYIIKKKEKDFRDEEAVPDYFVKLNHFYPLFPKPYGYYQDAAWNEAESALDSKGTQTTFTDRQLATVTVRTKRNGVRKLDLSKPAIVVDAYDAFNLAADYGMNTGTHNWVTFPQQVALCYIGDMGMEREFFLQVRYDGKPLNNKQAKETVKPQSMNNGTQMEVPPVITYGRSKMEAYHYLKNLDKLYIYTDYAPREVGSIKYDGSNQPDVVIDFRRFEGEAYQTTYRDRRYLMKGYSVCDDFYSPDYSQKPLPGTKDYRRTLYWSPKVVFDSNGESKIKLYNNSKTTVISVSAEGMTPDGQLVIWKENQ